MPKVFTSTVIYPFIKGGTLVEWTLHPKFLESSPYAFTLQVSHSGNPSANDWKNVKVVAGTPGTASYSAADLSQRIYSNADILYYRVKLVTGDNHTYYSVPNAIYGDLTRSEQLIARDIIRKEQLRLTKFAGSCGLLFRAKLWGLPCDFEGCLDHDTGAVHNDLCPTCFGTGWIGGYFPGVEYWIDFTPEQKNATSTGLERGTVNAPRVTVARAMACPMPLSGDFFWESKTDRRWEIENVAVKYAVRNVPIILELTVALIPPTDILQDVPVAN